MTNNIRFVSKIKSIFPEELLRHLAAIADTRRIDSSQKKMMLIQQLLKYYKIKFDVLGGATNRLALFIDGYAFKFALDSQGYKDNFMEYSLAPELQPYVTKIFETNGYISVAEPVKTMTQDDFMLMQPDMRKILEILASDYLLGDVGLIKKNFTNWGIRDDGTPVILDFAYVHRATENLFTCSACGDGMLIYDSTYSYLKCSNGIGGCHAVYHYNERKLIQGEQVDLDMIEDSKKESITISGNETCKDLQVSDGEIVDKKFNSLADYRKYVQEEKYKMMYTNVENKTIADLIIDQHNATDPKEIQGINEKIRELTGNIPGINKEFMEKEEPEPEPTQEEIKESESRHEIIEMVANNVEEKCEEESPETVVENKSIEEIVDEVSESPIIITPTEELVEENNKYDDGYIDDEDSTLDDIIRMSIGFKLENISDDGYYEDDYDGYCMSNAIGMMNLPETTAPEIDSDHASEVKKLIENKSEYMSDDDFVDALIQLAKGKNNVEFSNSYDPYGFNYSNYRDDFYPTTTVLNSKGSE